MNSRNDIRKFCISVNSLTPQKPKFNSPNYINTANGFFNNTDAIAEEFNNHFCSCGKKLSDKVDASISLIFSTYFTRRVSSSMFLALLPQWKFIISLMYLTLKRVVALIVSM